MIIGTYRGIVHYHPTATIPPNIEIREVVAGKVYPISLLNWQNPRSLGILRGRSLAPKPVAEVTLNLLQVERSFSMKSETYHCHYNPNFYECWRMAVLLQSAPMQKSRLMFGLSPQPTLISKRKKPLERFEKTSIFASHASQ